MENAPTSPCACVKAGKHCIDCLPRRRGKCSNLPFTSSVTPSESTAASCTTSESIPVSPTTSNESAVVLPSSTESTAVRPHPADEFVGCCESRTSRGGFPDFTPISNSMFSWGDAVGSAFSSAVKAAYSEVVHWKRNIFMVPSGAQGEKFTNELSRLFRAYAEASALESVALYAAMAMPALLLQKPHKSSRTHDHIACLERRLRLWDAGDIHSLLQEGRCIQQRLPRRQPSHHSKDDSDLTRRFTNLMQVGKTKDAVRLLSDKEKGGLLHLNDPVDLQDHGRRTVRDILVGKHPPAQPVHADALIHEEDLGTTENIQTHPVLFDRIDAAEIHSAPYVRLGLLDLLVLMQETGGDCAPPSAWLLILYAILYHSLRNVSAQFWSILTVWHHSQHVV